MTTKLEVGFGVWLRYVWRREFAPCVWNVTYIQTRGVRRWGQ